MTEGLVKQTSENFDFPESISHRPLIAVDGSVVKEPGSRSPEWRIHYATSFAQAYKIPEMA